MDITLKRIIVRESLVFTSVLLLSIVVFLFTYAYNWYYNQRINKLSSISISNEVAADSLSFFYRKKESKQIWFFEKLNIFTPHSTPEEVFKKLYAASEVDSVGHKWNGSWKYMIPFLKSIGFDSPKSFKKFIDENNISNEDVSDLNRSVELIRLNQEIAVEKNKALDKIFSYNEKIKLFWLVFVCSFVFAFFIRFIL